MCIQDVSERFDNILQYNWFNYKRLFFFFTLIDVCASLKNISIVFHLEYVKSKIKNFQLKNSKEPFC